ncbi:single-stranded DNA-binding protein [Dellaglioa carnosa]|uniref:Single-stranded DNA-binding protein n=1 Tax=Dellaglioa carnosa TaxID=2995136 RepID=A0ABT4JM71_9LACO|nr:single-stranded DNA-binding protein [Dellaglioa carnosa]MCZ2491190.1 single-stranded DNA-binding protein [Dellaglioa carnosa]MCZ2494268.1 single-stranded DNA-binding protein [Dellaglioa carnosa]MDK1731316.1 single-stranded DNA-binding protein [Dellaglioa carnosa]
MINRTVLVGRLTRDPDLRYTASGAAVATFTVAVNRQFTNASGEREADFISCVIWRKAAENFANFTHKGSLIGVDGRIQTRSYDNQQGTRVYVTEVVVENFSLLESKSQSSQQQDNANNQSSAPQSSSSSSSNNNANPFGGASSNNNSNTTQTNDSAAVDPFANNGQQIDISDDDLPF